MIDYGKIAQAVMLYEREGYQRIEVPWWATADIINITKPTGISVDNLYKLSVNGKCLLASGEQAFLYLANKGQLPPGKYQTVTPCFRNEAYDRYHSKHFMKLELIQLFEPGTSITQGCVNEIAAKACITLSMIAKQTHPDAQLEVITTGVEDPIAVAGTKQLDVVLDVGGFEIELGSYGARRTSFATWLYGTGIAEPRLSRALWELD